MAQLSQDAAYLISKGVPYDRAITMPPAELRKTVKVMRKTERRSPAGRIAMLLGGIALIVIGVTLLAVLIPMITAVGG